MIDVELPLEGGCLCGAVRYELRAAPYLVYVCHCLDCRRQSGAAYGMSMPAAKKDFALVQGEPAAYPRVLPSGRRSTVRFCAVCACRVYAESATDFVAVRPGTLDDTTWLRPAAELWARRALPWARVDGVVSHDEEAPDLREVARLWRAQGVRFV